MCACVRACVCVLLLLSMMIFRGEVEGVGWVGEGGGVKLQELVYDILPPGGTCRKAVLGVWGEGNAGQKFTELTV